MWLLYVLAGIALIAGLSAGSALGLHLLKPDWSERKRTLVSAAIAAFLPMGIAFGGFFSEVSAFDDEFMLGLAALVVIQLLVLTICALPPAWWTTSKLSGGQPAPALPEAEDPHLIEG